MEISLRELQELARFAGEEAGSPLSDSISIVSYRANQVIYKAGETFMGVNIILRGIVKNVAYIDGHSIIPALMIPRDVVGSAAFYSGTYFNESVAISDVDAISIPSATFDIMIRNSADFREHLSDALARALAESALMINMLANARAEVRVIYYLLKIYSATPKEKSQPGFMDLGLNRTEIGDFLGLTRETVSRKLTTLNACGFIRMAGQKVQVRDPEALRRICGHILLHS